MFSIKIPKMHFRSFFCVVQKDLQFPVSTREGGDNGLFNTIIPIVFLFVGLTTFGTLGNFDWFIHQVECPNISTTNCNLHKG